MIENNKYNIKFINEYLESELYQFEVESKGCLFGVIIETKNNISYNLDFYDTTRFKQDMDIELEDASFIYDYNIIILKKVTLKNIINAINKLWVENSFVNIISN